MARYTRGKSLIKIFARTHTGEERLIAATKAGSARATRGFGREVKVYDYGQNLSYVRYIAGCAGPQGRWFSESAADICEAFTQAGLKAPKVRKRHFTGYVIAPFFSNAPQADGAPAQRIG